MHIIVGLIVIFAAIALAGDFDRKREERDEVQRRILRELQKRNGHMG